MSCRPLNKVSFDPKNILFVEGRHSNTRTRRPRAPHERAVSAMAGISSSAADAVSIAPPPKRRSGADDDDDNDNDNDEIFPLLDLLQRFPDLFVLKVLAHLDPIDRTFLAQAGSACRAAVAASDLPRAGTRQVALGRSVWVVRHKITEFCTSVERLAWAKASGCPWVAYACEVAALSGRLDVLQCARAHDCPWSSGTCTAAALRGHLEVLTWAREHGCPWDSLTCAFAAGGGHLAVLRWARANDCPWGDTCYYAASSGHLEVLQWARAHGGSWSKRECESASWRHPATLAWVLAQPE